MLTEADYAIFASGAYNNRDLKPNGGTYEDEDYALVLPNGWQQELDGDFNIENSASGFGARVFHNGDEPSFTSGSEIVISFRGTDEFPGPDAFPNWLGAAFSDLFAHGGR